MKKIRCPECEDIFSIELDEYEDGDYLNCPECNLELVVISHNGNLSVKPTKEKEFDESFDEFYDEQ